MQLLSFLIIAQVLFAGIILNSSAGSKDASLVRHTAKQVLGTSIIADDSQPSDTQTSSSDQSQTDTSASDQQPVSTQNTSSQTQPTDQNAQNAADTQPTVVQDNPTVTQPADTTTSDQNFLPQANTTVTPTEEQNQSQLTPTLNPGESLLQEVSPTETPSAEPSDFNQQITSTPSGSDQTSDKTNTEEGTAVDNAMPNANASDLLSGSSSMIITNPDSVIANPQPVDEITVQTTKHEDEVLSQSQTPQQKENNLLSFAKDKVITIDNSLKHDDFTQTSYLTQRFNEQLDQSTQTLNSLPPGQYNKAKQDLQTFCKQADLALKTEQVSVPEDLEQDVIIARGKCLTIQQ